MRIAYGVMGYGRGHATRTATVLPELTARHDVLLLAGRDAYAALSPTYNVVRIPSLSYVYGRRGRRSIVRTAVQNTSAVLDLLLHGPSLTMVMDVIREFRADVIISDAEAWTNRVGMRLGIPRIAFDHFGILTHCNPPVRGPDRFMLWRERCAYRALMGQPQRVIVSSFYEAPARRPGVRVVGPLLRDEVLKTKPGRGGFLLAYFNQGAHQFTPWVRKALRDVDCPIKVYGTQRIGSAGNLEFCPTSNQPFLTDLANCRAVISTAGNQLVGEALHFRKPMLVMPETCVEQRCNANAIEEMRIGMQVAHRKLTTEVIRGFLAREDEFQTHISAATCDGRTEALDALETYLKELGGKRATPAYIRKVS